MKYEINGLIVESIDKSITFEFDNTKIDLDDVRMLINYLKDQASLDTCTDNLEDDEFNVDDFAGGNIDDAYTLGHSDGSIEEARYILDSYLKVAY